tara:strand:+ start:1689 stop:1868 length:180 start_codon:yes stop_codon:yes gene_type:complete
MDGLKPIDTKPRKRYKILPPYYLEHRLILTPEFKTTHINDYTIYNKNNKYKDIKSKYKM